MNNNLDNISLNGENKPDKIILLKALNEELFLDDTSNDELFETEAQEGLQNLSSSHISHTVDALNKQLLKQLSPKKRKKRVIADQTFTYITIVTILLLAIVAFFLIHKLIP